MEGLILLVCIIILVILISLRNDFSANLKALREKIDQLDWELQRFRETRKEEKPRPVEPPSVPVQRPIFNHPKPEPPKVIVPESMPGEVTFPSLKKETVLPPENKYRPAPEVIEPPSAPRPGFFERNPDLEKFIGENLANKIGIGILVLGIGFFVKYAIDQNWIHEIGRVFIGIFCGAILLGVAHYLRNKFNAFSSVLVGGGIAVLYLTITIGFQEYQIFSQAAAFIIMIGITAFTIALSLTYNRIELAVVAILGGFGSPFMVSTGEGNYVVLFTYILTLNVGMLVLAYYKKWNLVNIVCYGFTVILFGSWLAAKFDGTNASMTRGALFFGTAFYLIFFAMNIINNLKERIRFKALDFSLLLSNTFFFYSAGMFILSFDYGFAFRGLFTIALAIFNFIFVYVLYRNGRADRNLVFLLIGKVLTFVSLAAPVQLEGNYITLFWAAEAVLLLWLSQKSGIRLMKLASLLVNGLMVVSLIMDWGQLYFGFQDQSLTVIFNKAYITGLFSLGSLALTLFLLKGETAVDASTIKVYQTILTLTAIGVFYFFNLFELQYQLRAYDVPTTAFKIVTGTYNMLFILILIVVERFLILTAIVRPAFAAWGPLAVFIYWIGYHTSVLQARDLYLTAAVASTGFFFHYALVTILIVICVLSIVAFRKLTEFNESSHHIYAWFFVGFFVFLASFELDHLVAMAVYQDGDLLAKILEQNHKIGWPILWGLAAFLIIFMGLKQKIRHLRVISLMLFLITLLKLFLVDIQGISEGGKIAAFISLGILLLIISFMYQRLKKLLLTDDVAASAHLTDEKS